MGTKNISSIESVTRLAAKRGVRLQLAYDRPILFQCPAGGVHKRGESFRLDGRAVLCLGRAAPDAPPKTYLFARIAQVEAVQRREDGDAKKREGHQPGACTQNVPAQSGTKSEKSQQPTARSTNKPR